MEPSVPVHEKTDVVPIGILPPEFCVICPWTKPILVANCPEVGGRGGRFVRIRLCPIEALQEAFGCDSMQIVDAQTPSTEMSPAQAA